MDARNSYKSNVGTPMAIVIAGVFIAGGLYFGLNNLSAADTRTNQPTNSIVSPDQQAPTVPRQPTKGITSIDDDPVLGDKDAPVTIVEFSDYECPFCKRHFTETFPQLIKNYVDTGKVKIVYRDFPLSFHDPMATKEAVAANCAKEQSGDSGYFQYHDEIFTRTISNGSGLSEADLSTIATDLGLNLNSFNTCLSDPAQEEEVKKDIADAGQAGVSGTPTFVIGKSTASGEINGDLVAGAQPFAVFKAIIDPLLQ